jgi:hypothetical protein
MFNSMSHSRHVILITKASHVHIHGRARLVCLRVMNEENLKLIGKADNPICSVVQRGCLQGISQGLKGPQAIVTQRTVMRSLRPRS